MDFKEFLKGIVSEEQVTLILDGMKENKFYISVNENVDERYNKLKTQKEDLETQLVTANSTITDLKKATKGNEDLQKKLTEYETQIQTLQQESEAKVKNLTLDHAIEKLLTTNNAKHIELLKAQFERDKLEINEDGTIKGLEDQFKTIKESYSDLFQAQLGGQTPNNTGFSSQTNSNTWQTSTDNQGTVAQPWNRFRN